jgi:hypothetical protein
LDGVLDDQRLGAVPRLGPADLQQVRPEARVILADAPAAEPAGRPRRLGAEPAEHVVSSQGIGGGGGGSDVVGGGGGGSDVGLVVGGVVVGGACFVVGRVGGFGGMLTRRVVGGAPGVVGLARCVGATVVTVGEGVGVGMTLGRSDGRSDGSSLGDGVGSAAGGVTSTPSPQSSCAFVAGLGVPETETDPDETVTASGSAANQAASRLVTGPPARSTSIASGQ